MSPQWASKATSQVCGQFLLLQKQPLPAPAKPSGGQSLTDRGLSHGVLGLLRSSSWVMATFVLTPAKRAEKRGRPHGQAGLMPTACLLVSSGSQCEEEDRVSPD